MSGNSVNGALTVTNSQLVGLSSLMVVHIIIIYNNLYTTSSVYVLYNVYV